MLLIELKSRRPGAGFEQVGPRDEFPEQNPQNSNGYGKQKLLQNR
jgi:hypothetical protein